jgi:hypothetical protein
MLGADREKTRRLMIVLSECKQRTELEASSRKPAFYLCLQEKVGESQVSSTAREIQAAAGMSGAAQHCA